MARQNTLTKEYVRHQHKVMMLLGLLIVLLTYNDGSRLGTVFGSLIMGVGLARVRD